MPDFSFRAATPDDAAEIAESMRLGFATYRSFTPRGWEPPDPEEERIRDRLAQPEVWCQMAEAGAEMAGHVSFIPAAIHGAIAVTDDPGLAHFWQLFVREPWWGSGLAVALHAAAVAEATARGFERFRLFTPAEQGRARRFYEREGWRTHGEVFFEPHFGWDLIEYRRTL